MFGINLNDEAVVFDCNNNEFQLPASWRFVCHTGISKVKLVSNLAVDTQRFVQPVRFDKKQGCYVRNVLGEVLGVPMGENLFHQTDDKGIFTSMDITNGEIQFTQQLFAKQKGNTVDWKLEGDTLLLNEDIIHLNVVLEIGNRRYKFWYNKPEETK